jgi:hypothetical protein
MSGPTRVNRVMLVLALVCAMVFAFAGVAHAESLPVGEPTMGLNQLQTLLDDNGGTVDATMKTVVKGEDIVTINLTIQAITDGPLILFSSDDPQLTSIGGIAEGMSGSPIYVQDPSDGNTPKVIGALSYGDIFTLGNYGLATPIEQMLNIKTKYGEPLVQSLPHPIITPAGVVDKVMIDRTGEAAPAALSSGIAVAKPMTDIRVLGGIPTSSRLFKRAVAQYAKLGYTLVAPSGMGSTPQLGDQTFTTDLVPGASLATMDSRGDVYYGAIGTVTYADGNSLLAFGHPYEQSGATTRYLQNAWIDGIWPSSLTPYKLGRLGALRGTITQDRANGVMGTVGALPAETPITGEATNTATGESTCTTTYMPTALLNGGGSADDSDTVSSSELPVYAASAAGVDLFDEAHTPGSAEVTTTIVIRDTTDPNPSNQTTYTITIPDFLDDDYDIPSAAGWDIENALESLQELRGMGAYTYDIESIDLQSKITPRQRWAEVLDVSPTQPLHSGDNTISVQVAAYGYATTQTVPVKLTIPAGVPLNGTISADGAGDSMDPYPSGDSTSTGPDESYWQNVSDVVKSLNAQLPGNYLTVRYSATNPAYSMYGSASARALADSPNRTISIVATQPTPWATDGSAVEYPVLVSAELDEPVMDYQGFDTVDGEILDGPDNVGVISVYARPAGSPSESLLGTTTADPRDDSFEFDLDSFSVNTMLRIHVPGGDGYFSSDTTLAVPVHCYMSFSPSASAVKHGATVTLTAKVWPSQNAGAKVRFEYYSKGSWLAIATKALSGGSTAKATTTWKVPKGSTKIRCRFLGSSYNAATTSGTKIVKGK